MFKTTPIPTRASRRAQKFASRPRRRSTPRRRLSGSPRTEAAELDLRGLAPPQAVHEIVSAVDAIPIGVTLHARTDRQPLPVFAELVARGVHHVCETAADGSWLTIITR